MYKNREELLKERYQVQLDYYGRALTAHRKESKRKMDLFLYGRRGKPVERPDRLPLQRRYAT